MLFLLHIVSCIRLPGTAHPVPASGLELIEARPHLRGVDAPVARNCKQDSAAVVEAEPKYYSIPRPMMYWFGTVAVKLAGEVVGGRHG